MNHDFDLLILILKHVSVCINTPPEQLSYGPITTNLLYLNICYRQLVVVLQLTTNIRH